MAYHPTPHKCPRCRRPIYLRIDVSTDGRGRRTEQNTYECLHCDLELEGATVIRAEGKEKNNGIR